MKTLKSLLIVAALILATGSVFATSKSPVSTDDVSKSVREKIASVILNADFQGKGEVIVNFEVTEKNNLKILNIESANSALSLSVKDALRIANIKFPEGSDGIYRVKVSFNETSENFTPAMVRQQVMYALNDVNPKNPASVTLKLRVSDSAPILVLKSESENKELAAMVKNAIEEKPAVFPKVLNGDYKIKIRFE